jgi:hypothetical protein
LALLDSKQQARERALPKNNDDKTREISRKRERKAVIAAEAVGQRQVH